MNMAKMGSRYHAVIYHIRFMYLMFDRNMKRTEQFFVREFGLPQDVWDSFPKSVITNI